MVVFRTILELEDTSSSLATLNSRLNKVYVSMQVLIITGIQASGVIIDPLLRQCCFVWSEIVGPHSSGNFNDQWLLLKPELLWLLIVYALQLNELSALRNTFYPEYKYVSMYVGFPSLH